MKAEGTMKETGLVFYDQKTHQKLVRKAKRDGWQKIVFHTDQGVRNGWLVEDTGKVMKVRLVGDLRNRRVSQRERKFVILKG